MQLLIILSFFLCVQNVYPNLDDSINSNDYGSCHPSVVTITPHEAGTVSISYDSGIFGNISIGESWYTVTATANLWYEFSHWSNYGENIFHENPTSFHSFGGCPSAITTLKAHFILKDSDGDGLSDEYEVNTSLTNPNDSDSDDDGFFDNEEINIGFNPNISNSNIFNLVKSKMKDLRVGSQTFGVSNGNAKIRMFVDESSDLTSTWSNTQHVLELDIPADVDTKFYRFRMD